MNPPKIYLTAEEIGTAYWIEDGTVMGAALLVDGGPDWANTFDADGTPEQARLIAEGLKAMAELAAWIATNEYPRP